jgi:VanZ family protein
MALTPHMLMVWLRRGGVVAALATAFALTGPFHYSDLGLPFPDTVAHGLLFYALTLVLLAALPRSRSMELVLAMMAIGAASEVAQAMVGREMSFNDFAGDSVGVLAAYAPVMVGRLRELVRSHPHVSFAELRRQDRRRAAPAPAASGLEAAVDG